MTKGEQLENAKRMAASFEPDTDHRRIFPGVSVVTTPDMQKFMHDVFKLGFVKEREGNHGSGGVELLWNIAAKHDYQLVSKKHRHMFYLRVELMRQRLEFLRTQGLDERQKLREIQKRPPSLVFSMTNSTYHGKLVYLRGLVRKEEDKHVHIYTPVAKDIFGSDTCTSVGQQLQMAKEIHEKKNLIEDRIHSIGVLLNISKPAVLRELFNIPCFFMDPALLELQGRLEHLFAHLRSMPKYYNVDQHTLQVMPPVCDLESLGITPSKHLRWSTRKADLLAFPTFTPEQVLDTSYPTDNGQWSPECLSTFLLRADQEELKQEIQGGEVGKPRKGFNVPPFNLGSIKGMRSGGSKEYFFH